MLNLPQAVKQATTSTLVTYYYDATGNKLSSVSASDGAWEYINGIVYKGNNVAFIQIEEGKASILPGSTSGLFSYTYDLKDHLGNIRASFDNGGVSGGAPRVVQEDDYYPFGWTGNTTTQ